MSQGNVCKVLVIRFANNITFQEIPLLRGAIIQSVSNVNNLFHNHEGDGYRYAYPLI